MHKLTVILCVLFLFSGIFSPIWQGQQLNQHRKDIKKQIRNRNIQAENIDTLIFEKYSKGEIRAEDEIEVNGMMYDVLTVECTSQGLVVIAFRDIKEKQLLDSISRRIHNEIPWSTSPNFKIPNNLFFEEIKPFAFAYTRFWAPFCKGVNDAVQVGFTCKHTQPPELLFS